MANFGGKLVILGPDASRVGTSYDGKTEIFCVEIALEKWGGEIWGKVETVEVVLTVPNSPSLEL
ncbi:hypothetical protein F2Q68_00019650 [Brassica cretica]|uniref:Uncharacterized protein n=1 Tax=Brassica cretica TaxID=69181 RepID=A0A8S9FZ03_BRACR|nr:hypothetical protein F2Q68_00019650 [Brassica cretica]